MSSLCIHPSRPDSTFRRRTVQLVRYEYSSVSKRSKTVYVGSLRLDADPAYVEHGLRLREGSALSVLELEVVREWLSKHGDPVAREHREQRRRAIEAEVRATLKPESPGSDWTGVVRGVVDALASASTLLADRFGDVAGDSRRVKALRSDYLEMRKSWEALFHVAQGMGVAKKSARSKKVNAPPENHF